jgi:hypothetical protein
MLLWLLACTPRADLVFSPDALDFGDVDFAGEMPDGGYASEDVTLTNDGHATITLSLPEYDADRLCLAGFDGRDFPVELGEIDAGSTYRFSVGVCAYVSGEIDTSVETELAVDTDGNPDTVTLPITFTPIRTSDIR